MLTIHYGDLDSVVYNTSIYFNNSYSSEWFSDQLAQRMIKSVDKGIVLGPNAIHTKVLGIIPPEKLSSGTKTLLLMLFQPNVVFNASNCGDKHPRGGERRERQAGPSIGTWACPVMSIDFASLILKTMLLFVVTINGDSEHFSDL